MGPRRLFDTSAVIDLVVRRGVNSIPGFVSALTVVEYPPALLYIEKIIYPTKDDYALAIKWQQELRRKGTPLPAVDLIIAATAYNRSLIIVTRDRHFETLKSVQGDILMEIY